MKVLDLFCGAGGLSSGFSEAGFDVTGVDVSDDAEAAFKRNQIGEFRNADLSEEYIEGDFDILLGGPPCKPWSSVNTTKRGKNHDDHKLVEKFFDYVRDKNPEAFMLENVPPLKGSEILEKELNRLGMEGEYNVCQKIVQYSDYGASTSRNRLIVFGSRNGQASDFFNNLESYEAENSTVGDKIGYLRDKEENDEPNHTWPNLTTIHKYKDYYETGKFGWYILDWEEPAPSFGNVTKTYILHPTGFDREPPRVISVREAALIMGFDRDFIFPDELGLSNSYQLIVDSVSPDFSRVAAKAVRDTLDS